MGPTVVGWGTGLIDQIEARPPGPGRPPMPTAEIIETLRFFLREGVQWRELQAAEARASGLTLRRRLDEWLTAETQDGERITGRARLLALHDDWALANAADGRGPAPANAAQSVALTLSMPPGTPPPGWRPRRGAGPRTSSPAPTTGSWSAITTPATRTSTSRSARSVPTAGGWPPAPPTSSTGASGSRLNCGGSAWRPRPPPASPPAQGATPPPRPTETTANRRGTALPGAPTWTRSTLCTRKGGRVSPPSCATCKTLSAEAAPLLRAVTRTGRACPVPASPPDRIPPNPRGPVHGAAVDPECSAASCVGQGSDRRGGGSLHRHELWPGGRCCPMSWRMMPGGAPPQGPSDMAGQPQPPPGAADQGWEGLAQAAARHACEAVHQPRDRHLRRVGHETIHRGVLTLRRDGGGADCRRRHNRTAGSGRQPN